MCHGQNCSVKFEDCVLEGCPLVISEGSNVTLSNTNCSSTGCAIMAKGAGTKLTVNLGTFSQVHQVCCVVLTRNSLYTPHDAQKCIETAFEKLGTYTEEVLQVCYVW